MKIHFIAVFLLESFLASAQDTLTLQGAVEIALKNNYDVLLVAIQSEEATMLNTTGEAGMLPSLVAGASDQYSSTNIYQRFASGDEIRSANATGNNLNSFVALDWTLFSGFRLKAIKSRLEELDKRGQLALKAQIAQTVYDVTAAYTDEVRLKRLVQNTREVIQFNEERVELARMTFEAGLGPKTEFLQAQVDLNARKQQLSRLEAEFRASDITLNNLLARDAATDVLTSNVITRKELDIEALRNSLSTTNYDLQIARSVKTESEINEIEAASWQYPEITLSGAYNFTRNDYSAGFSLQSQNYGPSVGINIGIPLYDGGILRRQKKTAALRTQQAELMVKNTELNLKGEMEKMVDFYNSLREMIVDQETNIVFAKENLDIATERFRQGQSNDLEVRQAELSYSTALYELTTFEYELKMVETRLLLLAGQL